VGFLALLTPFISGLLAPIQNYFTYKQELSKANQELSLARIQADKEAIISGNEADTNQRGQYLGSVTQPFRQGTFYFFMVPFLISMFFPAFAQVMWQNFAAIPDEFKKLFFLLYSVIWGLPIAKEHVSSLFASVGNAIASRREYKIVLNETKVAAKLRETIFKAGMTQGQWEAVQAAIKAGQEG
jgi:hypothetical protein